MTVQITKLTKWFNDEMSVEVEQVQHEDCDHDHVVFRTQTFDELISDGEIQIPVDLVESFGEFVKNFAKYLDNEQEKD